MSNIDFTNTFQNGLFKDTSLLLQPDGTYRDMKNFQLVSQDGNSYTIADVLGNRLTFTLPVRYSATIAATEVEPMPIGFISFTDRLIVFFTNKDDTTGGYGEIGELKWAEYGEGVQALTATGYTPLYHHNSLLFSRQYKIEGFGYDEAEQNKKVYWTDFYNEPRVFNIDNPIFTTYISSGSLVSGQQYMVLQGAITYNAVNYGCGLTATNIFTANATTTFATAAGTPLVIKYYPYELLGWTPTRSYCSAVFYEYGSGVQVYGSKVYFTRLGSTSAGYFTSWSYGSYPIHIGGDNTIITGNAYHDFVGNGTATVTQVSNKSIKLNVSNIDTNFDVIELACAEFDQDDATPRQIVKVGQYPITGTSMTLEHFGNENSGVLTLNDITLFPASILKCKTITTNKNYNIIGNTVERQEYTFDKTGVSITAFEYPLIVHGDDQSCSNGYIYANQSPGVGAAPALNGIKPYSRYMVTGGAFGVDYVEYPTGSGNFYGTGQPLGTVFVGTAGNNNYTLFGAPTIRPCVNLNKYTTVATSISRENPLELRTAFWDYKDPLVSSTVRGYWSREWYRFGILFYDKKGNPFYVRHLGDYQIPNVSTKGGLMRGFNYAGTNMWCLNPSLIKASNITISEELANNVSGFSIVRAERDARIVSQGLVFQNVEDTALSPDNVRPSPTIADTFGASGLGFTTVPSSVLSYISPDHLSGFTPDTDIQVNQSIEEACWLDPVTWNPGGGATAMRSGNGVEDVYAKLFYPLAADAGSLRSVKISNFVSINENATVVGFPTTGDNYTNYNIIPHAISNADDTCSGGGGYTSLQGRGATGGKKIIINPASEFKHYGQFPAGYNYSYVGTFVDPLNARKIIMNVVTDKSTFYGGSTDQAIANTLYMSTGHFQPITSSVLTDTSCLELSLTTVVGVFAAGDSITGGTSGATATVRNVVGTKIYVTNVVGTFSVGETINDTTSGATAALSAKANVYQFNNVEIGGGDCYTTLVDYGYGLQNNASAIRYSLGLYFPCESNVNYNLRRGRKISNDRMGGANGVCYSPSRPEEYSYNPGYSAQGQNVKYPALPVAFPNIGKFKFRMRFAGLKYPGETEDSFRKFLTNDYKDVDGQLGEINNVRTKGDRIIYWQNHGIGTSPVLERQVISNTSGSATSLGTGGVIDNFTTLSEFYGNQHQHGLTETDGGWIWFDMRNKDVCIMDGGVQAITTAKGLKSFFNEIFVERGSQTYTINFLNDPTWARTSDMPLMGVGIVGVYDPKFEMSYLTFKFKNEVNTATLSILNKDFTIGYHHRLGKFIGFYDKYPAIWHRHGQIVLSANNPKNLTKYYGASMPSTDFVVGEVIGVASTEYIVTAAGNVPTYAATPSVLIFAPLNKTNEIYVENQESSYATTPPGYMYNKFYGRVVNNEVEVVVNPKTQTAFSPLNVIAKAVGSNITDVYYTGTTESSSDTNIKSWNQDYKYIDGAWTWSVALDRMKGRITDYYYKMKLVKKNYDTVPTTEAGRRTVIQWLRSILELKL